MLITVAYLPIRAANSCSWRRQRRALAPFFPQRSVTALAPMMRATAEREGHAGERNYRRGRRRVLDEHASAAVFGLNEPISFVRVEELDDSF
jgi:hypothetical protein